jgi:hypothetical protein
MSDFFVVVGVGLYVAFEFLLVHCFQRKGLEVRKLSENVHGVSDDPVPEFDEMDFETSD